MTLPALAAVAGRAARWRSGSEPGRSCSSRPARSTCCCGCGASPTRTLVLDTDGGFGERTARPAEPLQDPGQGGHRAARLALHRRARRAVDRSAGRLGDRLGRRRRPARRRRGRPRRRAAGSAADFEDARIAAGWPAMGAEIVPGETIPAETGVVDRGGELHQGLLSRARSWSSGWTVAARRRRSTSSCSTGRDGDVGRRRRGGRRGHGRDDHLRRHAVRCWPASAVETSSRADDRTERQLEKIRALCLALPEVTEEVTWGDRRQLPRPQEDLLLPRRRRLADGQGRPGGAARRCSPTRG